MSVMVFAPCWLMMRALMTLNGFYAKRPDLQAAGHLSDRRRARSPTD
jgi:hypothetical protein